MLTPIEARNAVVAVVDLIAESPSISELDLVAALETKGFSHVHAEKLCAFVPSAFTWALLKRMDVRSFPNYYLALDGSDKGVHLPISKEPYFNAALQLACDSLEYGWSRALSKANFQSVFTRSAEYSALDQALRAGKPMVGVDVGPFCLVRISAAEAAESEQP